MSKSRVLPAHHTVNYLKTLLEYNPETGLFIWIKSPCNFYPVGTKAGQQTNAGYVNLNIEKVIYRAHRIAWLFFHGEHAKDQIDHKNNIRNDNRICNLRECNNHQNSQNLRFPSKNNKLGILGVHQQKDKFVATITVNRRHKYIGKFDTAQQAHEAYLKAKLKYHSFYLPS